MFNDIKFLKEYDEEIYNVMDDELSRQQGNLELIASENIVSEAVLKTMGSIFTNKYAEGYPEKRYYGGCEYVDVLENIAKERACKLFGAEHANVQPHSGSQANMAVYFAVLKYGDTAMGMDLSQGGHLTHGSPVNISGKYFNFVSYGVNPETGLIDYEAVLKKAKECKPKLIVCGASAYPRTIDFQKFRDIADEVGAYLMVDMAHIAGLVAAGFHASPVKIADFVTTTTHKTLRGPRGGMILCKKKYAKIIDKAIFPGTQGGPFMHIIAAKAVCFGEALKDDYKKYVEQIVKNAKVLANGLVRRGNKLVSGTTDNHMMLMDLREKNITGKDLEERLDKVHITVNKNTIPNDPQNMFVTSGVRIGTPAVTTRGMKEDAMEKIAELINCAIEDFDGKSAYIKREVKDLCTKYPIYEK